MTDWREINQRRAEEKKRREDEARARHEVEEKERRKRAVELRLERLERVEQDIARYTDSVVEHEEALHARLPQLQRALHMHSNKSVLDTVTAANLGDSWDVDDILVDAAGTVVVSVGGNVVRRN